MMEQADAMRAEIYLLLASLFRRAPNQEQKAFLAELAVEEKGGAMSQAWQNVVDAARQANLNQLEEEYQTVFIGIGRGEVVPFASWHITGSLMEKPLAELRQHMAELGLSRNEAVKEPEDHISALCECMALLITETSDQQQVFFHRHITPWFEKLATQIEQAQHAYFYRSIGALMQAFFRREQIAMTPSMSMSKHNTHTMRVKNLVK
ncbi:molecular chaperone [Vibrio cincinnatiensis]|jgi:TorA maturation chaperone TorD|uniref:Chaperone TorD involved in molybdoenzyme TorA maturation n=1 Tax=Vibrio cincinnatiensis DSM 19608 TaxID=1123491 RepID=A0A1T4RKZ1_VIBCI|nr:molecular chaperone TorD family protein [Vibrio cincinnatiensis]MCG3721348.1 molecular chaperone [Vibrio cincinnatiensis]MCG3736242.1 molecular chaperone [Vibrio cincinnatiensis]MCG3764674.1 molecular chaperone [Vibrio cincinnatiensis]SKA16418.1 chaperone TorD involved in molybdoenzyme TorA maturation [Vibrio cincinnatiensis DSM 19608]SUP48472.1 Putative formate dehydrogenase-specific chaperone [Vibrio cincinnatiensis]